VAKIAFVNRKPFVRSTWVALSALAAGALLGGAWALVGRRLVEPALVYTALQSAFSAAVLGAMAGFRWQGLSLDVERLRARNSCKRAQANDAGGGWNTGCSTVGAA